MHYEWNRRTEVSVISSWRYRKFGGGQVKINMDGTLSFEEVMALNKHESEGCDH